jgi:hypothetical protein
MYPPWRPFTKKNDSQLDSQMTTGLTNKFWTYLHWPLPTRMPCWSTSTGCVTPCQLSQLTHICPTRIMSIEFGTIRRRSPFSIIGRVIGTLMGWFTQRRLNNLRDRIEEVEDQQHRLLHVQTVQLQHLEEIESAIKQLYRSLKIRHTAWVSYSSLDYARDQLRASLQKLIRALQAAHHRRLSIDLLPSDTLKKLFDAAARKARSHHHQLLLRHPSELLQIETSYVHDVHLILHIPMAPSDLLMRLFQLRPFPLPFTETHMLMPNPDRPILAISANADRLSVELSAVYLLGCHRVNQVYMCEQSGVLKRYLNDTCLGSLYMQDLQGATTLCEMNIVPVTKTVLQLQTTGIWSTRHSP